MVPSCMMHTPHWHGMWNTRVRQCCLFSYVYQRALKGVGCDKPVSVTIAVAFSGIGTLVDKLIQSTQVWLKYVLSYTTDRPGLSVGRPTGALSYFVIRLIYMVGLRLVWRSVKIMPLLESSWLIQGVVPIPIVFGTNSCNFYYDHHLWYLIVSQAPWRPSWYWFWIITTLSSS